jgi:hypothetical protein
VNKNVLTAKVADTFKTYGDTNPVFRIIYDGFVNGDGPGSIIPPVASTTADVRSCVGNYPVTLSGGSADNYILTTIAGNMAIKPALLTVKADDKTISEDDNLPRFTSTITGFKNGDDTTIVSGPAYQVAPKYYEEEGNYTITPSKLVLSHPANYTILYVSGILTVIEEQHHHYNDRRDSIPGLTRASAIMNVGKVNLKNIVGANELTKGQKLKFDNGMNGNMNIQMSKAVIAEDAAVTTSVYPNPTYGKVRIKISGANISANAITITDVSGRTYSSKAVKKIDSNSAELDMSNFTKGVYFIKVKMDKIFKIFKVIKL